MPKINLTEKEAELLVAKLDKNSVNAKKVKRFLKKSRLKKVKKSPKSAKDTTAPDNPQDDEAWVAQKQKESPHTTGDNLTCSLCHKTVNELWSDACYDCFRDWSLSCKPKKKKKE